MYRLLVAIAFAFMFWSAATIVTVLSVESIVEDTNIFEERTDGI